MNERAPYHCAVFLDDVGHSTLGDALGRWNDAIQLPAFPITQDSGAKILDARARSVRGLPRCHVVAESSTNIEAMRPERGNRWHHIGYPTSNIKAEVRALETVGYRKQAWDVDEAGDVRFFAYLQSPNGLRIELTALPEGYFGHLQQTYEGLIAKDIAAGIDEKTARGRTVSHVTAVVDDIASVAAEIEIALGIRWGSVRELVFSVNGETFKCQEMTAFGSPGVRLVSALPSVLGQTKGWQYVAFDTDKLEQEVALLKSRGYVLQARVEPGEEGASALLTAPEGTHIMLVEAA